VTPVLAYCTAYCFILSLRTAYGLIWILRTAYRPFVKCVKPRSHSPGVRPGASRQFVAGGPGLSGANREDIRVRSYIHGSTTDQTKFGAKSDHDLSRLCYGLRRYIPDVAPEVLRCVPERLDKPRLWPGHRRQSPSVSTASHESRTAKTPVSHGRI